MTFSKRDILGIYVYIKLLYSNGTLEWIYASTRITRYNSVQYIFTINLQAYETIAPFCCFEGTNCSHLTYINVVIESGVSQPLCLTARLCILVTAILTCKNIEIQYIFIFSLFFISLNY